MTIAPTPIPTAPNDTPDNLPGLAELVCALRHCAQLPGLLIRITLDLDGNAEASASRCDRTPRVGLGADLMQDPDSLPLYGVLAHEIAHHALDHDRPRAFWCNPVWLAKVALLGGLVLRLPLSALAVLVCVVLAAALADARRERLQEYDADTHAVRLLDGAGLPGRRLVAAALADLIDAPPGYRLIGWAFDGHPSARARRRTLATGRPARRLRWALMWQRTPTLTTAPGFSCTACGLGSTDGTEVSA
ncbi:Zn-dependent protease with chaperone function [Streptosporangium album]|uniref:Zn-dependent protease with chaperone function n=1 Tax=Streptosporangium album TaxID=47479 RepID=A0A7W7RVZ7_9ACTN|nr:M48 family metalloprotease [Streptosporangium album]MBB4938588.1 Zn-dependent protease with chaperone function [Streptosporangium album]